MQGWREVWPIVAVLAALVVYALSHTFVPGLFGKR